MSTTEDTTPAEQAQDFARPEAPDEEVGQNEAAKAAPDLPVLSFEDIARADDLPTKSVPVPEWGGSVVMRGLSIGQVDDLDALKTQGELAHILGLLAATIVEPEITPEQAGVLRQKSNHVLQRLLKEAVKINGLGAELERALVEQFPDE